MLDTANSGRLNSIATSIPKSSEGENWEETDEGGEDKTEDWEEGEESSSEETQDWEDSWEEESSEWDETEEEVDLETCDFETLKAVATEHEIPFPGNNWEQTLRNKVITFFS